MLQCDLCGETTTGALAYAKFTPELIAAMPPMDMEFREKIRNESRERQRQEQQERLAQFEVQRVEHTQKYYEYLKTPQWHAKRKAVLERDNYVCRGCLTAQATIVHHLTYDHVFDELLFELVAVCKPCHDRAHPEKQQ